MELYIGIPDNSRAIVVDHNSSDPQRARHPVSEEFAASRLRGTRELRKLRETLVYRRTPLYVWR